MLIKPFTSLKSGSILKACILSSIPKASIHWPPLPHACMALAKETTFGIASSCCICDSTSSPCSHWLARAQLSMATLKWRVLAIRARTKASSIRKTKPGFPRKADRVLVASRGCSPQSSRNGANTEFTACCDTGERSLLRSLMGLPQLCQGSHVSRKSSQSAMRS